MQFEFVFNIIGLLHLIILDKVCSMSYYMHIHMYVCTVLFVNLVLLHIIIIIIIILAMVYFYGVNQKRAYV